MSSPDDDKHAKNTYIAETPQEAQLNRLVDELVMGVIGKANSGEVELFRAPQWKNRTVDLRSVADEMSHKAKGIVVELKPRSGESETSRGFPQVCADAEVTTENATIGSLTDASVVSATLTGVELFAGINGPDGLDPVTHLPTPVPADAIGFNISGADASLGYVRPGGLAAGDQTSYLGLDVAVANAQLVGISGLDVTLSGSVLLNQAVDAAGAPSLERVDWATASTLPAGLLPAFSAGLTSDVEFAVAGNAVVDGPL